MAADVGPKQLRSGYICVMHNTVVPTHYSEVSYPDKRGFHMYIVHFQGKAEKWYGHKTNYSAH